MNAADFTFGIEIETHMPAGSLVTGAHGCGRQVPWLPDGWLADRDPSIITPHAGRVACEFVSPVLRGAEGLRQAMDVIQAIRDRGGRINQSCGLHVHVGFDKSDTSAVGRLINLVASHEKALYAMTGSGTREGGIGSRYATNWCKSIRQYGSQARFLTRGRRDRYHLLNIATTKPTVEFRVFGSTLNPNKIAAYVRMCVALCQKAIVSRRAAPFAKTASTCKYLANHDAGMAELNRLFFAVGWRKGRASVQTLGDLTAENIPTIEESKKELVRLATKYDSENRQTEEIVARVGTYSPTPAGS